MDDRLTAGRPETAKSRRPKILFVCNSLAGGGAERVFTSLLATSRPHARNYAMSVALLDNDAEAYALPDWLPVHRLDCRHGMARSLTRLTALAARQRPDLMVSFLTRSNVAAATAMSIRRRPVIISERLNTAAQLEQTRLPALSRAIVRATYPRATQVIAVSQGIADTLSDQFAVASDRITVINNPVDSKRVRALGEAEPPFALGKDDVVAMGRLCDQKNFALAIRAFARSNWPGRLILLGQGPLADELRALGDSLGLSERLMMPGFVANPYAVLSRAGLFLMTSNFEGFCNAIVEAMALGVPILSTDCPFSPAEILRIDRSPVAGEVRTGEGGLLVMMDDERALTEALGQLRDAGERDRLGEQGRRRVDAFDPGKTFDRYWTVIDEVLRDSAAARSPAEPNAGAQETLRMQA